MGRSFTFQQQVLFLSTYIYLSHDFLPGMLLFKKDVIGQLFREGITSTIDFLEPRRAPRQQPGGGEGTQPLWYFPVDIAENSQAMVTSVKEAVVDMNGHQDPVQPSRLLSIQTLPPFTVPETDIEALVAINAKMKQRAHLAEDNQAIAATFFPPPIDCTADSAPTSPGKRNDADEDDDKDQPLSAGGGGPSSPLPLGHPKEIKTEGKRQRK